MEGWTWKALCNEAPFRFGKNLASSGIRTRDLKSGALTAWPRGRFILYMNMAAILVMWPGPFEQTFIPPYHRNFIWNLTLTGPVVSEEKILKCVDDDGWRWSPTYTISSSMSLRLRWATKLSLLSNHCDNERNTCILCNIGSLNSHHCINRKIP